MYMHTSEVNSTNSLPLTEIYRLGSISVDIVQSVLEVFERLDGEQARQIGEIHRTLDQQFQQGLHNVMALLQVEKSNVADAVSQVLMLKALERVGNYAQRIAELVLYQLEGEEPRHHTPPLAQDFPLPE